MTRRTSATADQAWAIIHTGGTFGCAGQPLAPLDAAQFLPHLQQHLSERYPQHWRVIALPVLRDSSQIEPHDWLAMLQAILALYRDGVRHIILLHGTDTLAYSAAFLAEALADSDLKLILTGSQLPFLEPKTLLTNRNSDAAHNLDGAIGALMAQKHGVYVAFADEVWPATTVQKIHSQDLSAFTGHRHMGYPAKHYGARQPTKQQAWLNQQLAQVAHLETQFAQLQIGSYYFTPQPLKQHEQNLQRLLDQQPDALILIGYGAANFPQSDELYNLFAQASQQGSLLIATTQVPFGGTHSRYQAGHWLIEAGVLPSHNLTVSAIFARLYWLCATLPCATLRRKRWRKLLNDS